MKNHISNARNRVRSMIDAGKSKEEISSLLEKWGFSEALIDECFKAADAHPYGTREHQLDTNNIEHQRRI